MNTETELQFDGWAVNRVSGDIARNGAVSRLPQQPLRILLELYDNAGAVVTREQLVKALWPAGIVDFDNGLNVAMRKLRVALDDVGDTPKYIETLPRVGYRFIGPRGAPSEPAMEAILKLPPRARLALVLTLAAFGLAIAGAWWWTQGSSSSKPVDSAAHVPSVRARELYLDGIHQRSRRGISILNARAAALRAIALDDNLSEGHVSLGEIYLKHDRNFAAAKKEFDRALELNDHSSRAWHHVAIWHADMGQVDEALAALRRAREIDPMALQWSANYGRVLYSARRYDEAIEFLEPLLAANPNLDPAHSVLAWALMATGDLVGAEEQLGLVAVPGINPSDRGFLYAKLGRREDALREIERLEGEGARVMAWRTTRRSSTWHSANSTGVVRR